MIRSVLDADVAGKTVFCRVDYNVPVENGKVMDDERIRRSLPTIRYILEKGGKLVLASHLGRPKGKVVPELSLEPVAKHLAELLEIPILFAPTPTGDEAKAVVAQLSAEHPIVLLENLRFNPGESKNDPEYAAALASFADLYVSDAFGTVHRAHASTVGITSQLPSYAGLLVQEEYQRITSAMQSTKHPAIAIIGGAKVSSKLDVIVNFLDIVDTIVIGGGMAYTFLKSQGLEIGISLLEEDMVEVAKDFLMKAADKRVEIILPVDVRIAKSFNEPILVDGRAKVVQADKITEDVMGLDVGPKTSAMVVGKIRGAETIFWNGPLGVFEKELYAEGTKAAVNAVVERAVDTVVGGGDTAYAINQFHQGELPPKIHLSTGGGASLELMAGETLPGIACLMDE